MLDATGVLLSESHLTAPINAKLLADMIVLARALDPPAGLTGLRDYVVAGPARRLLRAILLCRTNPSVVTEVTVEDLFLCSEERADRPAGHVLDQRVSEWKAVVTDVKGAAEHLNSLFIATGS